MHLASRIRLGRCSGLEPGHSIAELWSWPQCRQEGDYTGELLDCTVLCKTHHYSKLKLVDRAASRDDATEMSAEIVDPDGEPQVASFCLGWY